MGDDRLEQQLRDLRPRPDSAWQGELRQQLFDAPRRRSLFGGMRLRVVAAGGGVATTALLLAGVLGGGPLSGLGNESVTAKEHCRYVTVVKTRKVPRIVQDKRGERIVYDLRREPARVKRCS